MASIKGVGVAGLECQGAKGVSPFVLRHFLKSEDSFGEFLKYIPIQNPACPRPPIFS
jgi:hypothetical protein